MSVIARPAGDLPWTARSKLYRSRGRALLFTLVGALGLHLTLLWIGKGNSVQPLPPAALVSSQDLDLSVEPPPTPPARDDSGGGSIERGLSQRAEGVAKLAEPEPARVHEALKPVPKTAPPPTPSAVADQVQPEHGDAEEAPKEDLFALDQLLTQAESEQVVASQVRPRPAWAERSTASTDLPAMAGKVASAARNFGSGPGQHGGPGGSGRGVQPARTKESMPFGGTNGAFRGQVCSIPRGTPSIRSLGSCQPVRELYTDSFNIPTRAFDLGFPGLPGQNEWFAILYTGAFEVERSGLYEFRLASDDGSILEIDGQLVIDNDGCHGPVSRRGKFDLTSGRHQLRLRYFQGPRNLVSLQLFVTPPGRGERLLRPSF